MAVILHITAAAQWQQATAAGSYRGDTLDREGFIHCSEPHQVIGVADALFRGRHDLVLLRIDPARVQPAIRYEGAAGECFPHIYGPLNLDAVLDVMPLQPGEDGRFALPR